MTSRKPSSERTAAFRDPEIEKSMREAADIGVGVLRKYHGKIREVEHKGTVDLLTKADKEAESRVLEYLRRRHPDHAFVAEESWKGGNEAPSGYAWVLDPLDGTTNYAHGLPHYALSLGVVCDSRPAAGMVVDPSRDWTFHAARGRGAFLNRRQLRVSKTTALRDALLTTGFPYDRRKRIDELMALYAAFLLRTRGIRRFGVASLDLAYLAAGWYDGYYESTLHAWDVAAGWLLLTEAGGKITDYAGKPYHLFSPQVLAAPPGVHAKMLRVIREVRRHHPSKTT